MSQAVKVPCPMPGCPNLMKPASRTCWSCFVAAQQRPKGECSIEGCPEPERTRGWCNGHYLRWHRHGDPLAGGPGRDRRELCSVEDCGRKRQCRGYCARCYQRWLRWGDPLRVETSWSTRDLEEHRARAEQRFLAKVEYVDDCWLWVGDNQRGYGSFTHDGRRVSARKWSYSYFVDPVPDGYDVRTSCGLRSCVRPDHLVALPRREAFRSHLASGFCRRGHDLATNTVMHAGQPYCRLCLRENDRKFSASPQGRSKAHAVRARRKAAFVERVDVAEVYERDGWICQLCGEPIDPVLRKPHPMSVSLDHIVPYARGGTHQYSNVQAAHLACNSRKGHRV